MRRPAHLLALALLLVAGVAWPNPRAGWVAQRTAGADAPGPAATVQDGLDQAAGRAQGAPRVDGAVAEAFDAAPAGERVGVIVRLAEQADLDTVTAEALRRARRAAALARATVARQAPASTPVAARLAERRGRDAAHGARVGTVVAALQETAAHGRARTGALLDAEQAAGRVTDVRPYWIFNGFAASVDRDGLDRLAAHPAVQRISLDLTLTVPEVTSAGSAVPAWSLERVRAPQVWADHGVTGEGVVVAVLDTGVDGGHPALADRYRGRDGDHARSWYVGTREDYPEPGDGNGHGTHVAGSIVGGLPGEVVGVAPGAEWIAAKIFSDIGITLASIIHDAAQWLLAPGGEPAAAPHVANNSWGSDATHSTEFWDDVAAWEAAGILLVFGAGNAGPGSGTVGSPASFPHALAVGATDHDDVVARFSSRGPVSWDAERLIKPELAAPGEDVRSAWPRQLDEHYRTLSGTSMAAPHVSGVAALALSARPGLSPGQLRRVLGDTARWEEHMGLRPDGRYGAGVVDAHAATTRALFSGVVGGRARGPEGPVAATVTVPEAGERAAGDPVTGEYELVVSAGEWTVRADAYGHLPATATVTVSAGERAELDLRLPAAPEHTVSGTVASPAGPVAGASVRLEDTPVPAERTDDTGRFRLRAASGSYELTVDAVGHERHTRELRLDGDIDLDVTLIPRSQQAAAAWPEYQNNPARTGYSRDAPAAESLSEVWTAELGAPVLFGSPVVAGGRVHVTTTDGRLHTVSPTDGEPLWTFDSGANLRSTPAVDGERVFLAGGDSGLLQALQAVDGSPAWTYDTGGERLTYSTPTVVDGVVYVGGGWGAGNGGHVHAVDADTGVGRWRAFVGPQMHFGPTVADGLVFAGSQEHRRLVALDAGSGELRWSLTRERDSFVSAPSYADGRLYVATTEPGSGEGSLLAVDAGSGEVLWERAGHGDAQAGSPVLLDGLVALGSHHGGAVTAYERDSGEPLWRRHVGGKVSASLAVSDSGLLFGGSQTDQRVWALEAATGEPVWESARADGVASAPALADGHLLVADRSGALSAFVSIRTVALARPPGDPFASVAGIRAASPRPDP